MVSKTKVAYLLLVNLKQCKTMPVSNSYQLKLEQTYLKNLQFLEWTLQIINSQELFSNRHMSHQLYNPAIGNQSMITQLLKHLNKNSSQQAEDK